MGVDIVKYDDDSELLELWRKIVSLPTLNELYALPPAASLYLAQAYERLIYNEWKEWADASIEWSRTRRSRDAVERKRTRRWDRATLALAVLGIFLAIYFVTRSYPIEEWYVGLLAVALIVPYLTRRLS
jgi:hypothetical protein